MKKLVFVLLFGCAYTQRPGDILGPGTMCEPKNVDVMQCRDGKNKPWMCEWGEAGQWKCRPLENK